MQRTNFTSVVILSALIGCSGEKKVHNMPIKAATSISVRCSGIVVSADKMVISLDIENKLSQKLTGQWTPVMGICSLKIVRANGDDLWPSSFYVYDGKNNAVRDIQIGPHETKKITIMFELSRKNLMSIEGRSDLFLNFPFCFNPDETASLDGSILVPLTVPPLGNL